MIKTGSGCPMVNSLSRVILNYLAFKSFALRVPDEELSPYLKHEL
jgi:hypothetical protein